MCVEKVGAGIQKWNVGIFSSHFCVKSRLTLSPIHTFVAFFTYSGGSCSQITFEKIETSICQSQKQNLAFKLGNFWVSKLFRSDGEK